MMSDSHNLAAIWLLRHHRALRNLAESSNLDSRKIMEYTLEKASSQPIFCEVLDTRTQQLIEEHPTMSESSHFLVSNRLISKVLAMVGFLDIWYAPRITRIIYISDDTMHFIYLLDQSR